MITIRNIEVGESIVGSMINAESLVYYKKKEEKIILKVEPTKKAENKTLEYKTGQFLNIKC